MRCSKRLCTSLLAGLALAVCAVGAQTPNASQPSAEPVLDEFYEEAVDWCPWPDFVNIVYFPSAGFVYMDFIKFSVEENGSYFGDFPVLCAIQGLDKWPATGWIYDPKTGYSCWISVQVGEGKLNLVDYGVNAVTALSLEQSLRASPSKFVPIVVDKGKPFPDRLKVFLEELGPKLSQGSLEVTEYIYVPRVWRKTPLRSSVKRMSVEAWNKQVMDAQR